MPRPPPRNTSSRSPAPALRAFRLWLVALTRDTLADALTTLGLPAPSSM